MMLRFKSSSIGRCSILAYDIPDNHSAVLPLSLIRPPNNEEAKTKFENIFSGSLFSPCSGGVG